MAASRPEKCDRPRLGDYVIEADLDGGSQGKVFKATDQRSGRQVAMKIPRRTDRSPRRLAAFIDEVRTTCQAQGNPHVVKVIHSGIRGNGLPYLVLELLGTSLREYLDKHGPLAPDEACQIAYAITQGAAHILEKTRGVHGDIKPGNVMWGEDRVVKLIDLCSWRPDHPGPTKRLLDWVARRGRAAWPFRRATRHYDDPWAAAGEVGEVYSVGAVLYECVTGVVPPLVNGTPSGLFAPGGKQCHPAVRELCEDCLAAPGARYGTLKRLAESIDSAVTHGGLDEEIPNGNSGPPPAIPTPPAAATWSRQLPFVAFGLAAAAMGLSAIALVIVLSVASRPADTPARDDHVTQDGPQGGSRGDDVPTPSTEVAPMPRLATARVSATPTAAGVAPQPTLTEPTPNAVRDAPAIPPGPGNVPPLPKLANPPRVPVTPGYFPKTPFAGMAQACSVKIPIPSGKTPYSTLNLKLCWIPKGHGVPKGFWMAATETTREQWLAATGVDPGSTFKKSLSLPIDSVSWAEATDFCESLSDASELYFRLPTEAEWEHAARAGAEADANLNLTPAARKIKLAKRAWFFGNGPTGTKPVGMLLRNEWGLHDMLGNVCEWCSDNAPGGRVTKGGHWSSPPEYCKPGGHQAFGAGNKQDGIGFRVVLEVE